MSPLNFSVPDDSETAGNNAVHTEDGIGRLQMENPTAVPGDGCRYPTEE